MPKGYPITCSWSARPVPGSRLDRPNDGSLIFSQLAKSSRTEQILFITWRVIMIASCCWIILRVKLLWIKEMQLVAKWFKKAELKCRFLTQYTSWELTADESGHAAHLCTWLTKACFLTDTELITVLVTAIDFMTGIYGGGQIYREPGALMFKHNTFWGYYGYERLSSYASNKHRKTATSSKIGLSDNFIITNFWRRIWNHGSLQESLLQKSCR